MTEDKKPPQGGFLVSPRRVLAQRGTTLRCKGWKQETILRMLENNLENGERPPSEK